MKKITSITTVIAFLGIMLAAGCTQQSEETYLEGDLFDEVAVQCEPFARHILDAIAQDDYTLFITDFDQAMRKAMTEDQFANIVKSIDKLGAPDNLELINIEDRGEYYGVNYKVTYPDKVVIMLVVLNAQAPRLVSGLWFK